MKRAFLAVIMTLFATSAFADASKWKVEYPTKVRAEDMWVVVLYNAKGESVDLYVDKYKIGTMVWSDRVQALVYVVKCHIVKEDRQLIFKSSTGEEMSYPLAVRPQD